MPARVKMNESCCRHQRKKEKSVRRRKLRPRGQAVGRPQELNDIFARMLEFP